ncbi:MAG: hypothetical protein IAG13_17740 [Deltaproteobacteria bacterium]|nr:hypothetical protein [Nannocystaceae bacterium]
MAESVSAVPSGRPHPRLAAYLAGLPDGLASWPEIRAKGSMVRAALRVRPIALEPQAEVLPRLRELIEHPPLDSMWMTEVEYCALSLLVADLHDLDDAGFCRFWYDVMSSLVRSRLYSVMLRWVSAPTLLRSTAARWGTFHRGTELRGVAIGDGLQLDLSFPSGLLPQPFIDGYTSVWQAMIDHSSSRGAVAQLAAVDSRSATWTFLGFR